MELRQWNTSSRSAVAGGHLQSPLSFGATKERTHPLTRKVPLRIQQVTPTSVRATSPCVYLSIRDSSRTLCREVLRHFVAPLLRDIAQVIQTQELLSWFADCRKGDALCFCRQPLPLPGFAEGILTLPQRAGIPLESLKSSRRFLTLWTLRKGVPWAIP